MTDPLFVDMRFGDATLQAVPAVHYRVVFAEAINRICNLAVTRPDAIVVELDPMMAASVHTWLKELGIGPRSRKRLPCLLGLVNTGSKPVSMPATRMQKPGGNAAKGLAPHFGHRECEKDVTEMLPMSPTDSIIEAIRCACELDVPLYGVDLAEIPGMPEDPVVLEDPGPFHERINDYAVRNAAFAGSISTDEAHARRETAMAARLKAIIPRHRRVLFTCGLGHWRRIQELLGDASLAPQEYIETVPSAAGETRPHSQRCVIHPVLACRFLDTFPAVARSFETKRRHPRLDSTLGKSTDQKALLRRLLRRGYSRHFLGDKDSQDELRDATALVDFERMLRTYALTSFRAVPDLGILSNLSKSMMSDEFTLRLLVEFMKFPWAQPGDFPDVAVLDVARKSRRNADVFLIEPGKARKRRLSAIKATLGGTMSFVPLDVPWDWGEETHKRPSLSCSEALQLTWPPWENVVNAMTLGAIRKSQEYSRIRTSETFAGQLLDGLDIKSTIAAQARGKDDVFVYDTRLQTRSLDSHAAVGFPVVWIFDSRPRGDSFWKHYYLCAKWFLPFVRNRERVRDHVKKGNDIIASVVFGHGLEDLTCNDLKVRRDRLRGFILFSPAFHTNRQFARWFERSGGRSMPACNDILFDIPGTIAKRCAELRAPLDGRWQDDLVAIALPFANDQVTVVVPRCFKLSPEIRRAAAGRGTTIATLSLERFPPKYIERMMTNHLVPGTLDESDGAPIYHPDATALIGEEQDQYCEIAPERWRSF